MAISYVVLKLSRIFEMGLNLPPSGARVKTQNFAPAVQQYQYTALASVEETKCEIGTLDKKEDSVIKKIGARR